MIFILFTFIYLHIANSSRNFTQHFESSCLSHTYVRNFLSFLFLKWCLHGLIFHHPSAIWWNWKLVGCFIQAIFQTSEIVVLSWASLLQFPLLLPENLRLIILEWNFQSLFLMRIKSELCLSPRNRNKKLFRTFSCLLAVFPTAPPSEWWQQVFSWDFSVKGKSNECLFVFLKSIFFCASNFLCLLPSENFSNYIYGKEIIFYALTFLDF